MRPPSIPTTMPIDRDGDGKQTIIMKSLYNSLVEFREPKSHRILIQLFMSLPSRKDFPAYFNIITKPIAMDKIRERIERQQYQDEEACLEDFRLMFSNCKLFNEDDSQIHKDAVKLEEILNRRKEELHHEFNSRGSSSNVAGGASTTTTTTNTTSASENSHINSNGNSNNSLITADQTLESHHHNNKNNNNINSQQPSQQQSQQQQPNGDHNDTSMDSSSNISVEKCSLNTRRGRNADAPKRQLLTGYIIYASEIRKQVIDKNPNQNFGDISRLVGNEWKALPHDIRTKYDQRALIHNKRVRERAQRDLNTPDANRLSNGLHTPKMTKRKLAKLAKEQMRQHHLSISGIDDSSSAQSPRITDHSMVSQTPGSNFKHINQHNQHLQHSQPQQHLKAKSSKSTTVENSTQTIAIRFVEPPTKKRLVYSETFRKYIESLEVPNRDLLVEETAPERPAELPAHWLGAGVGRHESPEAALWALRDFMLQDAVTMRKSMEPYL